MLDLDALPCDGKFSNRRPAVTRGTQERRVSYNIGFGMDNDAAMVDVPTAIEAVALVQILKEIKFIRSPQEGEIGIEMLRVLAKEEGDEMPRRVAAPDEHRLATMRFRGKI